MSILFPPLALVLVPAGALIGAATGAVEGAAFLAAIGAIKGADSVPPPDSSEALPQADAGGGTATSAGLEPDFAALIGTWTGTLTAPFTIGQNWMPATLRVSHHGDQVRWSLEVEGDNLEGSGIVARSEQGMNLTGRLSPRGVAISYAVSINGPGLEGIGLGADNRLYRLALQRQN